MSCREWPGGMLYESRKKRKPIYLLVYLLSKAPPVRADHLQEPLVRSDAHLQVRHVGFVTLTAATCNLCTSLLLLRVHWFLHLH